MPGGFEEDDLYRGESGTLSGADFFMSTGEMELDGDPEGSEEETWPPGESDFSGSELFMHDLRCQI